MRFKLTYTKAQLIREARSIPFMNMPDEVLTPSQLSARNSALAEFSRKYATYESEVYERRLKHGR